MSAKKIIKGIAKTTGKYTLKGIGKCVELSSRGAVKSVKALAKNEKVQKIATGTGLLAASVMIPTVGVGVIGLAGIKYMFDNGLLGKDKSVLNEIKDIVNFSNGVTKGVSKYILSPTLTKVDKNIGKLGKKYQRKIDTIFR